jgi:thiosulfate/3-mercaptopyruvate sulfurtransferase
MADLDDPDRWLVTTDWLAEHLDDPMVRVLDVTGYLDAERNNQAHGAYLDAHIPGAVWFDVASGDGELSAPDSPLSWTWPPLAQIEAAMGRVGVDNDTRVVITARTLTEPYGLGTMWCTRAWWTLHHSGVDCAVLEGGLERWTAEGRTTESGDITPLPRDFNGADRRAGAIADRDDVLAALEKGTSCVVDALPPESFDGTRVNYARPGHITGAQNLPYRTFIVEPTAVFVPVDEARRIATEAGLFDVERAVLY